MALRFPDKDPNEVLDYRIDWTARLETDTIATSTWIMDDASLTIDDDSHDANSTTVWLSGGVVAPTDVALTNRVTTIGGRTFDQSVNIKIVEK